MSIFILLVRNVLRSINDIRQLKCVHITGQCFISKRWRITCAHNLVLLFIFIFYYYYNDAIHFIGVRFGLHSIFHCGGTIVCETHARARVSAINAFMRTHAIAYSPYTATIVSVDFRRCGTQFFAKLNLNSSPFFVLLSLMLTWWLFIAVYPFGRILFFGGPIVFMHE